MSFSSTNSSRPRAIGISTVKLISHKPIKWVELRLLSNGDSTIHQQEKKPQSTQAKFEVPDNLPLITGSTLRLKYNSGLIAKKTITIEVNELLCILGAGGKQVWKGTFGKREVEVEFNQHLRQANIPAALPEAAPSDSSGDLRPTTDDILNICPKFRILVMGKSGAGKSSLINKAFGVTDAHVSRLTPGRADINRGIPSNDNPRFLLHDSRGFEHGESDTVDTVRTFIKYRNEQEDIKEKLHAIWLCLEIPIAGGRLLETGVENFLELKTAGELGNGIGAPFDPHSPNLTPVAVVPIIVVFTKYDRLVSAEMLAMDKQKLSPTLNDAEEKAKMKMYMECISPFKELVGAAVPYTTVSTSPEYTATLSELVNLTFTQVEEYIADAAIVTGMSQKVNSSVKIRTSIEVGKRKYWKGLASSTSFPGVTLQECLGVIHLDIVKVWDLDDQHNFLLSDQFKALMVDIVEPSEARDPTKILGAGLPMLGAVAGIVSALAGPVAPIVVPILAGFVFAVWVHEVYEKSRVHLRRLMTYILDLTLVMQNLFWIQGILAAKLPQRRDSHSTVRSAPSGRITIPITRRLIKLAIRIYHDSDELDNLHTQIANFSKRVKILNTGGPDVTVEKIIQLINSSTINSEEAFKQLSSIQPLHGSWVHDADEPWDV
ncbi:hypothetical protein BDZ94DRAFT_1309441 [Collybia nuda]|uniref:G domain-containing protein n=1 Tax=Collybia nuda TaxID=64659 RepID=A0A9P6CJE7_9AGAR|nr:hypothetical protein BDZ94DRAFT_1309441 [Collybia nuda]